MTRSDPHPTHCPNCYAASPSTPAVTDTGDLACSSVCAIGLENGRKIRETGEVGRRWVAFFQQLDAMSVG